METLGTHTKTLKKFQMDPFIVECAVAMKLIRQPSTLQKIKARELGMKASTKSVAHKHAKDQEQRSKKYA